MEQINFTHLNTIFLGLISLFIFFQNRSVDFLKKALEAFDPKKIKDASDILVEASEKKFEMKYAESMDKFKVDFIQQTQEAIKRTQDSAYEELLSRYLELAQWPLKMYVELPEEERASYLDGYPLNKRFLMNFIKSNEQIQEALKKKK